MKESTDSVIEITDMTYETLSGNQYNQIKWFIMLALLEYIYCDEVHLGKEEVAFELFQISDKYRIPALRDACAKYLKNCLSPENVVDIAIMANRNEAKQLEEAAIKYMVQNIAIVFEKSDPTKLPKSVLYKLYVENNK